VDLYNHASAQLNIDAFQSNITLNDNAKANLSGYISLGEIKYNNTSVLNTANLVSENLKKTNVDAAKNSSADFVSL
jgi:hypothetical protein